MSLKYNTTVEKNFDDNNENCIEFLTGQNKVCFTFNDKSWIRKIKNLKEKFPDDVDYITNNDDSICGHCPKKFLKLSFKKLEMTEERKKEMQELAKKNLHR